MAKLESHNGFFLWAYVPSLAASVIFLIIFLVLTGLHIWKICRSRLWYCTVFAAGGLFQVIGYIGRAAAHNDTAAIGPYVAQNIFILLAPTLFAASIYMTLSRIIRSVNGEQYSVISPRWLTRVFVAGDILSFVVQGNSAPLSILGFTLWSKVAVIAGLGIQLVSFALFALTAVVFEKRIRRAPTPLSLEKDVPWLRSMRMLYAVSALILLRSSFRIVEYVLGADGYPLTHEWMMYCLDSTPMVAVMVIFLVYFPSNLQPATSGEHIPFTSPYAMMSR